MSLATRYRTFFRISSSNGFSSISTIWWHVKKISRSALENHGDTVLKRLEQFNFRLNGTKCELFSTSKIKLLSHEVRQGEVNPIKENTEGVLELTPPKTVKDVRSLISSFGFYRKFIPNCHQTDYGPVKGYRESHQQNQNRIERGMRYSFQQTKGTTKNLQVSPFCKFLITGKKHSFKQRLAATTWGPC